MIAKFLVARERAKKKREELSRLIKNDNNVLLIHYACENFNKHDGQSPRIICIAVKNLRDLQTYTFSIQKVAEELNELPPDPQHFDKYEQKMLESFNDFVRSNQNKIWVHWNMRDENYGFQAIAKRYRTLSQKDFYNLHSDNLFDLALCLKYIYGPNYITTDQRMRSLAVKNNLLHQNFLSGEQEAECWERGEHLKVQRSTLSKVALFEQIIRAIEDHTLKTEIGKLESLVNFIYTNPTLAVISLFVLIATFLKFIWDIGVWVFKSISSFLPHL